MILIFRMFLLYLILLYSNRRAGGANHSYVRSNRSFSCTEVKSFHSQTEHEHKTRTGQEIKGGLRIKADRNSNRCICCLSWATLWQAVTCAGQSPVPHGDTLNYQSTDQTSRAPLLVPVSTSQTWTCWSLLTLLYIILILTHWTEITFCLQTVTGGVGFQPPPVCTSRTWNIYSISGFH